MSGVLHPVGPEPEDTYWLRRAIVAGVALVLVIVVVALFVNGNSTGSAVAGLPTPAPTPVATGPVASPTPATSIPTPSASSLSPSPASSSAKPSDQPTAKPSDQPAKPSKPAAKPSKPAVTAKAGPARCAPGELRTTLTGDQRLKPEQKATFRLSAINGTGRTCVVEVDPRSFTLTVSSGSDRIWSSDDCDTALKPVTKKVAAKEAVAWTMTWNGRRSAENCQTRPEIPRPGTYLATAELKGAEPVQLRMVLRD